MAATSSKVVDFSEFTLIATSLPVSSAEVIFVAGMEILPVAVARVSWLLAVDNIVDIAPAFKIVAGPPAGAAGALFVTAVLVAVADDGVGRFGVLENVLMLLVYRLLTDKVNPAA